MNIRKMLAVTGLSLAFAMSGMASQTVASKQDTVLMAKGGKPEDKPKAEKPEKPEKPERPGHAALGQDHTILMAKGGKPEDKPKAEKPEMPEKPEKPERPSHA